MSAQYVVIDVGCHECGVSSEAVGIYDTGVAALEARDECDTRTEGWREGGQTIAMVFEFEAGR